MKLKRDIFSMFNNTNKYASAGDEIKIVSPVIVEGPDGNRFTISPDDILKEGEPIEHTERIINKIPGKKQNKISQPTQTLF